MTTFFNRGNINSKHLVAFSKPDAVDGLRYYDFNTKCWRFVEALEKLPYDLCSYRFLDEEMDENKCVVTCSDSYRLSNFSDCRSEVDMESERVWRDLILQKDAEMEYTNKDGVSHQAKVLWLKSDIVSGVIVCGPRKSSISSFGYIYKESVKFSKSGTFFEPLSEEDLEKERIAKVNADRFFNKIDKKKEELKDESSYISKEGINAWCWDTRPYFSALNHCVTPITKDYLMSTYRHEFINPVKMEQELSDKVHSNLIIACIVDKSFDTFYEDLTENVKDNKVVLLKGDNVSYDFFFDLRVVGATYAILQCGCDYNNCDYVESFTQRIFNMINMGEYFTLPSVTLTNPLHRACDNPISIITDGISVSYKAGVMRDKVRRVFNGLGNGWSVNEVENRILFIGHLWNSTFSFTPEEKIIGPPPPQPSQGFVRML
jgi:hypothetical protein